MLASQCHFVLTGMFIKPNDERCRDSRLHLTVNTLDFDLFIFIGIPSPLSRTCTNLWGISAYPWTLHLDYIPFAFCFQESGLIASSSFWHLSRSNRPCRSLPYNSDLYTGRVVVVVTPRGVFAMYLRLGYQPTVSGCCKRRDSTVNRPAPRPMLRNAVL